MAFKLPVSMKQATNMLCHRTLGSIGGRLCCLSIYYTRILCLIADGSRSRTGSF
jgi:hypothetical protein